MDKRIQVQKIITQEYALTYTKFCEMDDVKDLTDEYKEKAWEKLLNKSKRHIAAYIITIDDIGEEVEWNDIKEDFKNHEEVIDAIDETVSDAIDEHYPEFVAKLDKTNMTEEQKDILYLGVEATKMKSILKQLKA
jgi:heme oxygenase